MKVLAAICGGSVFGCCRFRAAPSNYPQHLIGNHLSSFSPSTFEIASFPNIRSDFGNLAPSAALRAMEGKQGESKDPRDGGAHGAKHKVRAVLWTAWTGWTIWTTAQDLGLSQS